MNRVMRFKDELNDNKYILQKTYNGFGIYQRMTPTGWYVHQNWMISDNNGNDLVVDSYNNICEEELLDIIDNYNRTGKYGVKAVTYCGMRCVHPSGTLI